MLLLLAAMGANSIFNGHYVATKADGLPLGSYTSGAALVILRFYAMWGVSQLTIVAFGIVALVQYRALVPFVFLLLLVEQIVWRVVHYALPIAKPGASGGTWFIYGLLAVTFIGFVLSLWQRNSGPTARSIQR
ncbi:MAG: hypothetical protein EPN38_07655 [Rhodanobacteraceae bacterium]|nr:MAG: hypothetical protein EPN38_07655 [Rhodanobacteraceae bacterium]